MIGNPRLYGKTSIYYEITTLLEELNQGFHNTILDVPKSSVQWSKTQVLNSLTSRHT